MLKNGLKKLISLVSIIAMLTAAVPTASAVMLDTSVALDKTVVVSNANIGNKGILSKNTKFILPGTTGDYVISYPIKIVKPMSSFTLTMNISGKVSGYFTLDSYDEETGTYDVKWVEKNITSLGNIEVGKTYNVKYEYENIGLGREGKTPILKSLTLTDEDGNIAASGSSLRLRNFSDTSNSASQIGFSQAEIAITAIEAADAPEIELGDFVSYTKTGADEVVVSVDGTELNATGNDVIDIASSGTGEAPIILESVVKMDGEDVSADYKVVYSLKEDIKGISIEGNKLKVSSVAAVGTLNPVVVVSLTNADGTAAYDSFAEIEMNLNKAEPTPIEYLQGLLDTLNLDYDLNGYEIICQDDIYNVFYGVKGFSKGDKKADVEWKCYEQQDGEWVESDLINFETGEYTRDTDYDGTFKIKATAAYKDTSDKLDKEFICTAKDVYADIPVSSTVSSEISGGKLITKATFNGLSKDGSENIFIVTYNKYGYIENIKKYDSDDLINDGRNKKYLIQELRVSSADDNVYKQKAFIFDKNFMPIAKSSSTETSVEKITKDYAWLIDTYTDDGVYKAKILTQDNTISEFEFADTVEFWGSNADDEKENLSFKDDFDAAKEKISNSLEYNAKNDEAPAGLVKFKTDDDGKINMLYMSYVTSDVTENDRPTIYKYTMDGITGADNVIGKRFYLRDEMLEFTIATDYTADTEKEYSVKSVESSEYIHYDGVDKKFCLACFDGITANIAVNIISTNAEFTYNTADNNPIIMISEISKVDDGYEIVGYRNGEEVKYTTAYNVSVSEATGISGGYNGFTGSSNRNYGVTPIWTNSNKIPTYIDWNGVEYPVISEENQAKYIEITDALSVGDMIGVKIDNDGNAKTIIKMIDMPEYRSTVWGGFAQYSNTRDGIAFGEITEYLSKNTVGAIYSGAVIILSTGEAYQIKDIDTVTMYDIASGEVLNCNINDLEEGDKVFIRTFKGDLREVFAIR